MQITALSPRAKAAKAPLPTRSCALSVDFDELSDVPAYARKGVTVAHTAESIAVSLPSRPARLIAH